MSHHPSLQPRPWSLEIFRVSDHAHQQRALHSFTGAGMTGIHAVGVARGDDWFVIVDSSSADRHRVRGLVAGADPRSTSEHSTAVPRLSPVGS